MSCQATTTPARVDRFDVEDLVTDLNTLSIVMKGIVGRLMDLKIVGEQGDEIHGIQCEMLVIREWIESMGRKGEALVDLTLKAGRAAG